MYILIHPELHSIYHCLKAFDTPRKAGLLRQTIPRLTCHPEPVEARPKGQEYATICIKTSCIVFHVPLLKSFRHTSLQEAAQAGRFLFFLLLIVLD